MFVMWSAPLRYRQESDLQRPEEEKRRQLAGAEEVLLAVLRKAVSKELALMGTFTVSLAPGDLPLGTDDCL